MPKYELTAEQKLVVFSNNSNMIVSASAGTGKTTVMIDRIVRLIKEGQVEVKNLAVVTFTNLAAQEMRIKLVERLKEINSNDEKIFYQINDIDNASISTLHSFCNEVLRNYFYEVDIDPAFKIFEESELLEYKNRSLDDIFNRYYSEKDKLFLVLTNAYGARDDQRLRDIILQLYNFSVTIPDFATWAENTLKNYTAKNNPFAKVINDSMILEASQIVGSLDILSFKCRGYTLDNAAEFLTTISSQVCVYPKNSFAENYTNLTQFKGFPSFASSIKKSILESKIEPSEAINLINEIDDVKKVATEFMTKLTKLFSNKPIDILYNQTKETKKYIEKLIEALLRFSEKFAELKKENGGLDFSDLELMCLKVLKNDDIIEDVKNKYKFIFVDEYQDINAVQENIINLIKGKNNLFLVGDVKQSIYGFRECDPIIFADKINDNKQNDEIIFLNTNFRSHTAILDFVNIIFSNTMTKAFGKDDYKKNSLLKGGNQTKLSDNCVEINIIDTSKTLDNKVINGVYDLTQKTKNAIDVAKAEARVMAEKINKIVGTKLSSGKVINFNDIVILARVTTDYTYAIYQELLACNIPVVCESKQPIISGYEIVTLINFLKVLNNPLDDIALYSCLNSCLAKLSDNELSHIKLAFSNSQFFESLQNYRMQKTDDIAVKLNSFFNLVEKYRFLAHSKKVDELLTALIKDTNYEFYILALVNGNMRLNRLYGFINELSNKNENLSVNKYINFLNEAPSLMVNSSLTTTFNAVRIMSIHHSKGLEFPVVFVCELGYKFNMRQNTVVCDKTLGFASKYYNFDTMEKCNTLSHTAIKLKNTLKAEEEELRVLYVALTRAKNHLFLVGCSDMSQLVKTKYLYQPDAINFLQWIGKAIIEKFNLSETDLSQNKSTQLCESVSLNVVDLASLIVEGELHEKQVIFPSFDVTEKQKIEDILSFKYKYLEETQHAKKMVSSLIKSEQNDESTEVVSYIYNNSNDSMAEIGTAYHKIFELVDYKNLTIEAIENIKTKAVTNLDIAENIIDKIDANNIINCLRLKEVESCINNGKVYREVPFMLEVFRHEILDEKVGDEKVILQGVIDMLVITNGSASIFDYKITNHPDNLTEKYKMQMQSYEVAVNKILGFTNTKKYLIDVLQNKIIQL